MWNDHWDKPDGDMSPIGRRQLSYCYEVMTAMGCHQVEIIWKSGFIYRNRSILKAWNLFKSFLKSLADRQANIEKEDWLQWRDDQLTTDRVWGALYKIIFEREASFSQPSWIKLVVFLNLHVQLFHGNRCHWQWLPILSPLTILRKNIREISCNFLQISYNCLKIYPKASWRCVFDAAVMSCRLDEYRK